MKLLYTSLIMALVLFTGCSSKQTTINDQNKDQQKQENLEKSDKKITEQVLEDQTNSSAIATQSIYFDFDKFNIKQDMKTQVNSNAQAIKSYTNKNNNATITLEGNCDNIGTDEYNYALGIKRAKTIKDNLVQNGINSQSVVIKSLGESSPVCNENTKECRAQNRRVDYIVK